MIDSTKLFLRQTLRARRRALSIAEQTQAGQAVLQQLCTLTIFNDAQHIGCYLAYQGELATQAIISYLHAQKRHCYLPLLTGKFPAQQAKLIFQEYHSEDLLIANRYKIAEPIFDAEAIRAAELLDVVLVPLVAFDQAGHRLGQGGGYYDRTFAFKQTNTVNSAHLQTPYLIGLGYDFQQVDYLEVEKWDINLDTIITPTRIIQCRI